MRCRCARITAWIAALLLALLPSLAAAAPRRPADTAAAMDDPQWQQ